MKSRMFVLLVACLSAGLQIQGCDGDSGDNCTECWCNLAYCADGDSDVRPDGDVPVQYGSLTVMATAAGVEVNADINLDGSPSGEVTPHTFPNLVADTHSILLSYSGRMQYPSPFTVGVTTEGTNVNIVLYRALMDRWHDVTSGTDWDVNVVSATPAQCPDTPLAVGRFEPIGRLCVETDDSLSVKPMPANVPATGQRDRSSKTGNGWNSLFTHQAARQNTTSTPEPRTDVSV